MMLYSTNLIAVSAEMDLILQLVHIGWFLTLQAVLCLHPKTGFQDCSSFISC